MKDQIQHKCAESRIDSSANECENLKRSEPAIVNSNEKTYRIKLAFFSGSISTRKEKRALNVITFIIEHFTNGTTWLPSSIN